MVVARGSSVERLNYDEACGDVSEWVNQMYRLRDDLLASSTAQPTALAINDKVEHARRVRKEAQTVVGAFYERVLSCVMKVGSLVLRIDQDGRSVKPAFLRIRQQDEQFALVVVSEDQVVDEIDLQGAEVFAEVGWSREEIEAMLPFPERRFRVQTSSNLAHRFIVSSEVECKFWTSLLSSMSN